MKRSRAITVAFVVLVSMVAATLGCSGRHTRLGRRVIVLGFDGLDYGLTRDLMARGRLPNLSRLAAK